MIDYEKLYKELKQEQEDQRWREEREREEVYQRREHERRQRESDWQDEQLYADTWAEAFRKTLPRLRLEASEEAIMNAEQPGNSKWDTYFAEQVDEHEFARDAYNEEMAKVQQRIADIHAKAEAQIAKIEQAARDRAAKRIDKKFRKATYIAENLRNNDLDAVTNW